MHNMLFESTHRFGKCMHGKNHSIIVKFVLDEEMQIIWGERRMLKGNPYGINDQFAPETQNARTDIKSFLHTQDTSNYTIKISKDKLLMDGKPVVVRGKK